MLLIIKIEIMKTIRIVVIALLFTLVIEAQNKDVKETTLTTTTTVVTPAGEKKFVKEENVKEIQNIELQNEKPNTLNIERKDSPVVVTSVTTITNPDGSTRTVDVDRSSFYESNGNKYKLNLDASGYVMSFGNSKPALLRKTSTNSYIYKLKNKMAIGYFDVDGNLIIETYDDKSDKVTTEKYLVMKK
jgi:hypothetical protein